MIVRTSREALILVKQLGLTSLVKNGNRYKIGNVEKCGTCAAWALLPNWFDVNHYGFKHYVAKGFPVFENVKAEADVLDDGTDCCSLCRHTLDEEAV